MKRIYVKRDQKFWTLKRINKHSGKLWRVLIVLMTLFILWAVTNKWVNREPLITPIVFNPVTQVVAKEIIPCEKGVAEFLECEAVKGNITYKQAEIMLAIAKAESNLKERAANRKSSARGIFQIIAGTWYSNDCVGDKYYWKDNTICALKIMKSSGFYPWVVFTNGSYKKFL